MGLPFALWTRDAVGALIERETGVRLSSRSTISSYLRGWGFTPQRARSVPASGPRNAGSRPCSTGWARTTPPSSGAPRPRTPRSTGAIHWGDETGLSNQANYGRSFAPKGKTPVITRPATRVTTSMISTLTNLGTLRFMVFEGALNAVIFLGFLRRLITGAPRTVFLIVDNLRVHRARLVTAWVQANADRIELFYLPPYAPEHNPDEFLNNDVKQAMARRRIPRTKAAMKSGLRSYMRSLQRRPAKVRAFFQAPSTRYAA